MGAGRNGRVEESKDVHQGWLLAESRVRQLIILLPDIFQSGLDHGLHFGRGRLVAAGMLLGARDALVCLLVLHLAGAADAVGVVGPLLRGCLHGCLLLHLAHLAGVVLLQPGQAEHWMEGGGQLAVEVFEEGPKP